MPTLQIQAQNLITLPVELMEVLHAKANDELEYIVQKEGVLLRHRTITNTATDNPRQFGQLNGKAVIPENFDDENDEINKMFYGQ